MATYRIKRFSVKDYLIDKVKDYLGIINTKRRLCTDFSQIKKGDLIFVNRLGGLYQHYAVAIDDRGNILEFHTDNMFKPSDSIVRYNTIEKMSHGDKVFIEKPNGKYSPDEIVERAKSLLNKPRGQYNVLTNNCEHYARGVVNGKRISTQAWKLKRLHPDIFNKLSEFLK